MKYEIKIPKPCHEDWNRMTPTEKGMFCASCKKEVIDFTMMTEQQVVNRIKNEDNLCGRFKNSQVNKEIQSTETNTISAMAASIVTATMLFNSMPTNAQRTKPKIENIQKNKDTIIPKVIKKSSFLAAKGMIEDENGPLPGASVLLKGTINGTETDFDGNFSLKFTRPITKKDTLVISYLGYKTIEIPAFSRKEFLKIKMKEDEDMVLMGEVANVTAGLVVIKKRPSIFQRIGNLFKRKNKNRVKLNDKKD